MEELRTRFRAILEATHGDGMATENLADIAHMLAKDVERQWNVAALINSLAIKTHEANLTWWTDIETGRQKQRNVGELLMLAVSELAEAMEGHRKNLMDDKLPHRKMFEVELADCLIRLLDMAAGLGVDLGNAYVEKMAFNAQRPDHKVENRKKPNGIKY